MSLKLYLHKEGFGNEVAVEYRRFPAGETFLRLPDIDGVYTIGTATIEMSFKGNDDLFNLALLADALRRQYPGIELELVMPYLPYARQDRVCAAGESLSVKVVADFINSLGFARVFCDDIHSTVGEALLNNLHHNDLIGCFARFDLLFEEDTILVSPDAGANKKVLGLARHYGYPNVVRADKTRDVLSGKITGTVVYSEPVGDKNFLIVDDICDGGRTFIELAKELRKLTTGKVMLYVTHGIFSAGLDVFDGLIDHIYVNNAMNDAAFSSRIVTVF